MKNIKIFENAKIIGKENIKFGDYIIIDDFVFIYAQDKMSIGNYVHIASFTSISGAGNVVLEDFVAIASGCRLITSTDDFKDGGFGNPTIDNSFRNINQGSIKMKKFSIIGANSIILPNVTIGEGASIGAGSIVTRDIKPWAIYFQNRIIGYRNKDKVLKNYENFCKTSTLKRKGNFFK